MLMAVPGTCCPLDTGCHGVNGDPSQPVYGFRCDGVTRWYDPDGNEVSAASVAPCGDQAAGVPSTLTLTPRFFGDGPDPLGENLCGFSTPPDVFTGWTVQPGGCFDPPLSPSDPGPSLQWTTQITSLTFEYGNPPHTSGGVWFNLSTPQMGGTIVWPVSPYLEPGDVSTSNAGTAGRRVRLTYLSGPSGTGNTNRPFTDTVQVRMHLGSTDNTTPPTRIRLDFLSS